MCSLFLGSCGLEYTLEYTEKGQQQSSNSYHHHYHHYDRRSSSIWSWKFLIVVLILAYIIFKTSCGRSIRHRISRRFHRRDSDSHSRRPSPNTSWSTQAHKREAEYQSKERPILKYLKYYVIRGINLLLLVSANRTTSHIAVLS